VTPVISAVGGELVVPIPRHVAWLVPHLVVSLRDGGANMLVKLSVKLRVMPSVEKEMVAQVDFSKKLLLIVQDYLEYSIVGLIVVPL
jgi:hypothetical protein